MNWNLIANSLTALGTLLTATSIWLAYGTYHSDHDRSRRQVSFQLIGDMNKYLRENRAQIIKTFPEFYSPLDIKKLSQRDAEELYHACPTDTKKKFKCEDVGVVGDYLNVLEYVASGYTNQVADQKMIEESIAPMVISDYEYFEPFVKVFEREKGRKGWIPLQMFVDQIKAKAPQPPSRQPTG